MESKESPFFFEMVSYHAKSQSSIQAYKLGRERIVARPFRRGRTYFFNRVVGQNEKGFEPVNVEKQISSAINEHANNRILLILLVRNN